MKRTIFLLLLFTICFSFAASAQKKGKKKESQLVTDSMNYVKPDKKGKDKKGKKETQVNYTPEVITPQPDTSKGFTGVIKYRITSDDPSDKDSVFIVFGESRIRVTMFIPGYREGQVFEQSMIANLNDSTFLDLDMKNKTYKTEKLGARNKGTVFSLAPDKKTGKVMTYTCEEYAGDMTTGEGDAFEAACLVSKDHYFNSAMDFNFINAQPLVLGYRIVLGFRTKSAENENTYIMAYKIEPGNTDSYFDLSGFKAAAGR